MRCETEGGAGGSEASADGQAGEIEQVDLPGSAGVQKVLQLACFSYLIIDLAGGGVDLEGGGIDGEEELLPGGELGVAALFRGWTGGGAGLGSLDAMEEVRDAEGGGGLLGGERKLGVGARLG